MKTSLVILATLVLSGSLPLAAQTTGTDTVSLQLPNNPVTEVAGFYEALTGRRLILDSGLAGPNLSISVNQQVTKQEAIALIEAALILNGYTMIPVDDRTSKLLGPTKQARSESIPLYTDPSQLPEGEGIVSYFMPFRYIKIDEAQNVFNMYVAIRSFGSIVPVPSVNALVITENLPLVRRMIGLKQLIDVQGGRTATEFVELQRADAERVAEILNKLFEGESEQISSPNRPAATPPDPGAPAEVQPANPDPAAGGVAVASVGQKIQIIPDPRTNRLMIVAPESRMAYVKGLVANLDVAVSFDDPLEKQLRFAAAGDILPVLGNLLAEGDEEVETNSAGDSGSSGATGRGPGANAGDGGTTGAGGGTGGTKPDRLRARTESTAPESISVGKARIIADRSSNKIIVIGPPESRAKASRVIDMLDQRPKQVYLAVVIGQLTLGDGIEFGIDYLIRNGDLRILGQGTSAGIADLLRNRNAVLDILPGASDVINTAGEAANTLAGTTLPVASGLTVFGSIGDNVDIFARALASTNRFQIISRPVVYAANNQKAVISSGQSVPVPQSTLTSVVSGGINNDSNAVTSNIEYKDVVLKLEVIPLINSKNEVTLEIAQQNDNIQETVEISNNQVPVIGTQELTTTVTVPNRHTIILGGLITDQEQRVETGIPFLKDIPFVGYAFASTTKDTVRRELIVMIQPFIIDSDETLQQANFIERSNSSFRDGIYDEVAPLAPGNVPTVPSFGPSPEKPFGELTW
jgi:type II secretion system protein D